MTDDRLMVIEAVFNGQLSQDYLTQAEIDEFAILVADAAIEKLMDEAEARGCSVFEGIDGDPIH
jgi:hypothetical protein